MDKPLVIVEVGGIGFEKDVHGGGLSYVYTDPEGRDWIALRPALNKSNPQLGTAHSWWVGTVFEPSGQPHPLNSCVGHLDRPDEVDPLYHETDGGLADPPVVLLAGMARLIKETERHGLDVALEKGEPTVRPADTELVRVICSRCRRRYWGKAETVAGGPRDESTGAYILDDQCSELDEPPPSVEGRHLWYLYRVISDSMKPHAHLLGPDRFASGGAALCGARGNYANGWIRVGGDPMPNDGPPDRDTCPLCQARYNVRPDQIVWND